MCIHLYFKSCLFAQLIQYSHWKLLFWIKIGVPLSSLSKNVQTVFPRHCHLRKDLNLLRWNKYIDLWSVRMKVYVGSVQAWLVVSSKLVHFPLLSVWLYACLAHAIYLKTVTLNDMKLKKKLKIVDSQLGSKWHHFMLSSRGLIFFRGKKVMWAIKWLQKFILISRRDTAKKSLIYITISRKIYRKFP